MSTDHDGSTPPRPLHALEYHPKSADKPKPFWDANVHPFAALACALGTAGALWYGIGLDYVGDPASLRRPLGSMFLGFLGILATLASLRWLYHRRGAALNVVIVALGLALAILALVLGGRELLWP